MEKKVRLMGIVNLNDDSFYVPSRADSAEAALSRAARLLAEGADILDFGACSTRPGSKGIGADEEWRRLEPALKAVCEAFPKANISIDTYWSEVVRKAYELIGPFLVNDISAGAMDPKMLRTAGALGLPYVAMHMRGTPETMQSLTDYGGDIIDSIKAYFEEFERKADDAGISEWILDPGFGFAKTREQNWEVLERLGELRCFERPILVGLSRKSMFGVKAEDALEATLNAQRIAVSNGATHLRVHDVALTRESLYSSI